MNNYRYCVKCLLNIPKIRVELKFPFAEYVNNMHYMYMYYTCTCTCVLPEATLNGSIESSFLILPNIRG